MIRKALLSCLALGILFAAPVASQAGPRNGGASNVAGASSTAPSGAGSPAAPAYGAAGLFNDLPTVVKTAGEDAAPAIGVLLPLKGSYARYAEDAMDGVLLAADVFGKGEGPSGAGVEVFVRNVGADPAQVEAAVDDLASNPRVAGLVGPMMSSTAEGAARSAQRRSIPVITLTQKEGVTGTGDYVFRNFLTPSAQASAIAEYACKTIGKKRFAVLYPQNNYGAELARLFEKEVKARGCKVVRSLSYPQETSDFSSHIKLLFGVKSTEKKEGRRRITEYAPTVAVDGLYIPDFAETVSMIAPYLAYHNISGVQLLGSNGWNSPKLLLAGRDVDGAVFVDGFFPNSSRDGAREFVERFTEAYGRAPGMIEAQAYDAAAVLISAIRQADGSWPDRSAVKERLLAVKGYNGAAGPLSFDKDREAVKSLFILTVRDGEIVEAR